ncbi:hypothetical protein K505DRAFT_379679 [Melanomma pulvis-pyrius CBS 109.77]|uniref:Uncharacterized protein n=1 Tax=Melanomma pulvis-pyrius CBS 109.77 TaxID=1314802 RepID=A0A6A6WTN2_9PLEO|nr:hypothetical protein K505DRAFT_379679 [Melanomma pulvis-pyrius CBS 109.77]
MTTDGGEKPQTIPIDTFADAKTTGNTLLYFPRELRDKIYEAAIVESQWEISNVPGWAHHVDAKDIVMTNTKWLPPICQACDQFFIEALPIFLQHSVISIGPAYAAWNLHYFLQTTGEFGSVRSLNFENSDVLKKGVEAAQLIKNCTNLRKIIVGMTHADIERDVRAGLWTDSMNFTTFFSEIFIADQIFQLKNIEEMIFPELVEFKGLDGWLKEEFKKRGVEVTISHT